MRTKGLFYPARSVRIEHQSQQSSWPGFSNDSAMKIQGALLVLPAQHLSYCFSRSTQIFLWELSLLQYQSGKFGWSQPHFLDHGRAWSKSHNMPPKPKWLVHGWAQEQDGPNKTKFRTSSGIMGKEKLSSHWDCWAGRDKSLELLEIFLPPCVRTLPGRKINTEESRAKR